ncbi:MAG: response regulator [Candidatus Omnitrophica bacterium]|jgi:DNA-binding response OmpR family regulator|nr:response regulator [Candidatus Omnitrophota bacterium]
MAKILIIEDEVDVNAVLSKRLHAAGFQVLAALDAYQGLSSSIKERPDLIILDLMIPSGGGISVLKNLKLSSQTMSIPVVILSGMSDPQYKDIAKQEGAEVYVEKPYDWESLLGIIREVLGKNTA